jgi:hypothetical protein
LQDLADPRVGRAQFHPPRVTQAGMELGPEVNLQSTCYMPLTNFQASPSFSSTKRW